jgi:very-short-patch-repair endonuclease
MTGSTIVGRDFPLGDLAAPSVGVNSDSILIKRAADRHRLLLRSDVLVAGLSSDRWCRLVDAGTWLELAPGVWCHAATEPTWELRVRAGWLWLGPRAALFGPTAAAWCGLEDFARDTVELVVPRVRRYVPPRMRLHTTRRWDRQDLVMRDGVRCTTVTRTIIDLARVGTPARTIEAAIDAAVRSRLTAIPKLLTRIDALAARGSTGTALLRELLLDSGGESHLERRFLSLVRRSGLARPAGQVVFRSGTKTVARVDFLFEGHDVVVEVSGRRGHASDRDRQKDARRRNELQRRGLVVLEFTTADVIDDPAYVVATIRAALTGSPGHRITGHPPVGA